MTSKKSKPRMKSKIRCLICNDVIESMYRHDFKYCSCKAVFVDGGNDYFRYGGDPGTFEIIRTVVPPVPPKRVEVDRGLSIVREREESDD